MSVSNYADNLRHMAEPASPSERKKAVSITLQDYQALYLASMLREWAAYHADTEERSSIASGYVEYINRQVRENSEPSISLYAHTPAASEVVTDALYDWHSAYREKAHNDLFQVLESIIIDLYGEQHAEQVNKDAGGRSVYDEPPEEVEIGDGEVVQRDE